MAATAPGGGPGSGPPWSRRLAAARSAQDQLKPDGSGVIAESVPFARRKVAAIMNERPILPIFEGEFPFQVEFAPENRG